MTHPQLKALLLNMEQQELRLRLDKPARYALHQQLDAIDVDHDTVERVGTVGIIHHHGDLNMPEGD